MEQAFEQVRELVKESGGPEGIELVQARDKEKVIMFGLPGTLERINKGDFPPPLTRFEKDKQDNNLPWTSKRFLIDMVLYEILKELYYDIALRNTHPLNVL